ncbi:hypothetical protein DI09_68p80 [Mitosporidium daphniae]|uniref:Uncharacterized protein n=1 Tax=Mitosporidium daphniae TaxID=1485682 RepID=A0A098VNG9_9MICR|nr:uncharacterized protein DI09_68p80 [Mitosporidium daphniae]KGG50500.1 hypothetical protein DI09_68p80 [Mitosporidium daphniae]|eukprot:XP_013236947.1 uncharacterized protein DI09_68p80 [Mitosporidium daphniae]
MDPQIQPTVRAVFPYPFIRYPDGFIFIELNGSSILSKWYSESSKNLSLLFECIFSLAENEFRFIILLMGIDNHIQSRRNRKHCRFAGKIAFEQRASRFHSSCQCAFNAARQAAVVFKHSHPCDLKFFRLP